MTTICRNKSSRLSIARFLLSYGADVNITDKLSRLHPLQYAVWNEDIDMTKLLLENGADVNSLKISPLTIVTNAACRKLLLDAGANVTDRLAHICPLRCAIRKGRIDHAREYLNHSTFRREHVYSNSDFTPVQYATLLAIYPAEKENFEMLYLLLEKGLPVDSYQHGHLTPYDLLDFQCSFVMRTDRAIGPATFLAADNGNPGILGYLLNRGANVNFRNVFGTTALMVLACRVNCTGFGYKNEEELDRKCFSLLLQHGIDVNARDICGRPAIFYALKYDQEESFTFKWLLAKNVELYPCTPSASRSILHIEMSLLYHACLTSTYHAVRLLIDYGYNIRRETWLMKRNLIPVKLREDTNALQDLVSLFRQPEELKRLCRNEIRRLLGVDIETTLNQLILPAMLKDYLMFK